MYSRIHANVFFMYSLCIPEYIVKNCVCEIHVYRKKIKMSFFQRKKIVVLDRKNFELKKGTRCANLKKKEVYAYSFDEKQVHACTCVSMVRKPLNITKRA